MTVKKILVVAAHPDDEVLGCGGTTARHVKDGDEVHVAFMADGVTSRSGQRDIGEVGIRKNRAIEACNILGTQPPIFFEFPDNRMDSIELLEVVQTLETLLCEIGPTVIYTNHGGDLNIDHQITHQAVMTACRPEPEASVREIYSFEVLSSTEWIFPSAARTFAPNRFVDIGNVLDQKLAALNAYKDEIVDFPHSRSMTAVKALATVRGASMGMTAAEGFRIERLLE